MVCDPAIKSTNKHLPSYFIYNKQFLNLILIFSLCVSKNVQNCINAGNADGRAENKFMWRVILCLKNECGVCYSGECVIAGSVLQRGVCHSGECVTAGSVS